MINKTSSVTSLGAVERKNPNSNGKTTFNIPQMDVLTTLDNIRGIVVAKRHLDAAMNGRANGREAHLLSGPKDEEPEGIQIVASLSKVGNIVAGLVLTGILGGAIAIATTLFETEGTSQKSKLNAKQKTPNAVLHSPNQNAKEPISQTLSNSSMKKYADFAYLGVTIQNYHDDKVTKQEILRVISYVRDIYEKGQKNFESKKTKQIDLKNATLREKTKTDIAFMQGEFEAGYLGIHLALNLLEKWVVSKSEPDFQKGMEQFEMGIAKIVRATKLSNEITKESGKKMLEEKLENPKTVVHSPNQNVKEPISQTLANTSFKKDFDLGYLVNKIQDYNEKKITKEELLRIIGYVRNRFEKGLKNVESEKLDLKKYDTLPEKIKTSITYIQGEFEAGYLGIHLGLNLLEKWVSSKSEPEFRKGMEQLEKGYAKVLGAVKLSNETTKKLAKEDEKKMLEKKFQELRIPATNAEIDLRIREEIKAKLRRG